MESPQLRLSLDLERQKSSGKRNQNEKKLSMVFEAKSEASNPSDRDYHKNRNNQAIVEEDHEESFSQEVPLIRLQQEEEKALESDSEGNDEIESEEAESINERDSLYGSEQDETEQ